MAHINTRETVMQRIVEDENGCWIWQGHDNGMGYGLVRYQGTRYSVHRLIYSWHRGEISPGMHLDHLCRVTRCCNPGHLEEVTQQENCNRGLRTYAIRTLCKNGLHDITLPDAIVTSGVKSPRRTCRECLRISSSKWRAAHGRKRY